MLGREILSISVQLYCSAGERKARIKITPLYNPQHYRRFRNVTMNVDWNLGGARCDGAERDSSVFAEVRSGSVSVEGARGRPLVEPG